ncbi:endoplasmic reticulum-based factor for assembly of V-ATPase [Gregarina niphandrodes]|uniref:Endoplasmic reticulum-based factor for assembly of V-ATPase n=1 Tax=Gregarina niphandrodes TaxID=110365 RepID=A0A023B5U4_GRENI|nr:endoplasmic reticulum-based factor for assembly of V-ATPase [Gregarina niphandrodes]EZG62967.1 endoplasmic reticulum-based factor for assembly of V-ATPase [Gregarina niphandrodes]|eukprot:XP_011130705.1 endoplasmic reticulum-based factor for assembly of V-ATPase [Gregarina niphandrodes]
MRSFKGSTSESRNSDTSRGPDVASPSAEAVSSQILLEPTERLLKIMYGEEQYVEGGKMGSGKQEATGEQEATGKQEGAGMHPLRSRVVTWGGGIPLEAVLAKLKGLEGSAVGEELLGELRSGRVMGRDKSGKERFISSLTPIERIRLSSKERNYQRMLYGVSQINALKQYTENPYRQTLVLEVRQSLSIAVSSLMIIAASFFVGFYLNPFNTLQARILTGLVAAACGAMLELALMVTHFNKIDLIQNKQKNSGTKDTGTKRLKASTSKMAAITKRRDEGASEADLTTVPSSADTSSKADDEGRHEHELTHRKSCT